MRVLQINGIESILSTGRTVTEFDQFLSAHNVDSYIACSVTAGDTGGYTIGTPFEKKLHGLLSRLTGKQAWFSRKGTEGLLSYMDEIQPDIVILRVLHGNFIQFPMLMQYFAEKKIAVVLCLHDCWFFTGKCCYYSQSGCNKWQNGCGDCPRIHLDNISWFFDRTAWLWKEKKRCYDALETLGVIGVSDWITEEAKKAPLLQNAKKIECIYNGIDFEKFHIAKQAAAHLREKYNLTNCKILLGVSSDWSARKGLAELTQLAKMVSAQEKIVCIGRMPSGYTVPKNVLHIPKTDNVQTLAAWYSAADVFLNLSKEETFGKVSAEALSCGAPVVCFDTTANPELVGDGCGAVCRENSVDAYYACVQKILESGRQSFEQTCVAFAHQNFDKEINYAKTLVFLESLLESRP
ncbi:MAG: glycosyltransferase [Candidatus Fimenecus sp.]